MYNNVAIIVCGMLTDTLIQFSARCPPIALFGAAVRCLLWYQKVGKPVLYIVESDNAQYNKSAEHLQRSERHVADIHRVLERCPSLSSAFYPPLAFYGGLTQLIPFLLESWWRKYYSPPCAWHEELAELEDGEFISLGWANGVPVRSDTDSSPFLIIHHGASGTTADFPNQTYVLEALRRGWSVCVFNRRGHSRALSRPKWSFFGSTADVRWVTQRYFRERRPLAPVFMLGISAGSGVLARYMGEQGLDTRRREEIEGFCTAAMGISPGYDIEVCFSRVKSPFNTILMESGKELFLNKNEALLQSCETYDACKNASSVQEWYYHCLCFFCCCFLNLVNNQDGHVLEYDWA